jgi:hypothetical protein
VRLDYSVKCFNGLLIYSTPSPSRSARGDGLLPRGNSNISWEISHALYFRTIGPRFAYKVTILPSSVPSKEKTMAAKKATKKLRKAKPLQHTMPLRKAGKDQ